MKTEYQFKVGTYEDEEGLTVEIKVDLEESGLPAGNYPLLGLRKGRKETYTRNGKYYFYERYSDRDLVPPEPEKPAFKIDGPGRYLQRNGGVATVSERQPDEAWPWYGLDSHGRDADWSDSGHLLLSRKEHGLDLVAKYTPKMVPLEMDDIPAGVEFRNHGMVGGFSFYNAEVIQIGGYPILNWDRLQEEGWEYRAPGTSWTKCEKEESK